MSKDYGSWSVMDLKNELRKRNAKLTGKKAVLVQRLEDYDKVFGPLITDPENVFKIMLPAPQHFRDVTNNTAMPVLTTEDLEMFCQLTERADVVTSENMYKENFLMSCRIAVADNEHFVIGMVASEMRKNIIYNVAMKLKNNLIMETQCECAAGMGPYAQCKHILVLILGIIDFNNSGSIKLKSSSTDHLQTFHQPNTRHSGEPVKAEDLKLKFHDSNFREMATFDPRPTIESSARYTEKFKNIVANFCGQTNEIISMPVTQLLKPADKESIYSDHDYLKKTSEETFLEELNLTDERRLELEKMTNKNKKLWKRERLMRLHSSNYGRICKAKNCKSALARSLVKNCDITTAAIKHGLKYEDEAVRRFEEVTQLNTEKCGICVHPTQQFLASTPDRLVGDGCVLEIKCPFTARNEKITPESVPYLYLCERTGLQKLDKEHNYFYQVQGQLMCTGRHTAYFCVYTLSDIQIIVIERDDDFIKSMYEKLKSFYEDYLKKVILKKFLYNKKV